MGLKKAINTVMTVTKEALRPTPETGLLDAVIEQGIRRPKKLKKTKAKPTHVEQARAGLGLVPDSDKMYRHVLPAGDLKVVHVNPEAIAANAMNGNQDFPTIIVINSAGKAVEYHAVIVKGTQMLRASTPGAANPLLAQAKVFMETDGEIECFLDRNKSQKFVRQRRHC